MPYRILYVDNSDVVGQEASYEDAYDHLLRVLKEHPEFDDEIGIQEIDDDGKPVGEMTIGLKVAGQQLQFN